MDSTSRQDKKSTPVRRDVLAAVQAFTRLKSATEEATADDDTFAAVQRFVHAAADLRMGAVIRVLIEDLVIDVGPARIRTRTANTVEALADAAHAPPPGHGVRALQQEHGRGPQRVADARDRLGQRRLQLLVPAQYSARQNLVSYSAARTTPCGHDHDAHSPSEARS
ncbi:hypothetical protein [Streptomyces celluloflavus]|uniref:hypothetical protein n=1 Tax=Streptomyces celluloflavus TaxID=58344 RepID=UPI0036ACFBA9